MKPHVSMHDHPMHKGPHHDLYTHVENRRKGSHAEGDTNHIKSVMGKPKGADVAGHKGNMGNMGYK